MQGVQVQKESVWTGWAGEGRYASKMGNDSASSQTLESSGQRPETYSRLLLVEEVEGELDVAGARKGEDS